jgi:cytochrome c oxidase subunit 3
LRKQGLPKKYPLSNSGAKKLFRKNKWQYNYNFNKYFIQKTLSWYLFYYTMVPFKETLNETMGDNLLLLDSMFFKKWRDGIFYEKTFTSFIGPLASWLGYLVNTMSREIPKHPFHIVTPSPWPLLAAFGALLITTGGVLYMHSYQLGGLTLSLGITYVIAVVTLWWRDVIREASFLGNHTNAVQTSLKIGVVLFIVSEVMFFFSFFWAFFHSSLSPAIDIGSIWPPLGITPISPYGIPLFNSFILALSGYTVTYAHHAMLEGDRNHVFSGLVFTLFLAFLFSALQFVEYRTLPFLLADGIYGSTFFMTTGFHALHVIIGSTFLLVCLFRLTQFTKTHHIGFEGAIWYWHFVDVVWLFLWLSVYWWPSLTNI